MGKDEEQAIAEFDRVGRAIFARRKYEDMSMLAAILSSLHLSRR